MAHANAEALIRLLPYGQWNVEGGREVLRALEALGEGAVTTLAGVLDDPQRPRFLRLAAVWLLGRIGTGTARMALRLHVSDADPELASAASSALHPRPHAA
jgi:hypothetical protein